MTTNLKKLKRAYADAKEKGAYEFYHDEKVFVTSYAGYLIEWLEYQRFNEERSIDFTERQVTPA